MNVELFLDFHNSEKDIFVKKYRSIYWTGVLENKYKNYYFHKSAKHPIRNERAESNNDNNTYKLFFTHHTFESYIDNGM